MRGLKGYIRQLLFHLNVSFPKNYKMPKRKVDMVQEISTEIIQCSNVKVTTLIFGGLKLAKIIQEVMSNC